MGSRQHAETAEEVGRRQQAAQARPPQNSQAVQQRHHHCTRSQLPANPGCITTSQEGESCYHLGEARAGLDGNLSREWELLTAINKKKFMQWVPASLRLLKSDSATPRTAASPWDSPGRNTGVGCRALLQGIFPTQGLNPGLLHGRRILYPLSYQGSCVVLISKD